MCLVSDVCWCVHFLQCRDDNTIDFCYTAVNTCSFIKGIKLNYSPWYNDSHLPEKDLPQDFTLSDHGYPCNGSFSPP